MRCNPLRWLWGLIPLFLLAWGSLTLEQERVERDLRTRVEAALVSASLTWASAPSTGRDVQLSGTAFEESEQAKAAAIAAAVWGVRKVEDKTTLPEEEKNYTFSAAMRENRLKLAGFVPNEQLRVAIAGRAKVSFPGRDIDDRLKVARGAPNQDIWLGGVTFALEQLSRLKGGGRVVLEGAGLILDGEALDAAAYRNLKAALANNLPNGVTVKSDNVLPPAAKPYAWTAQFAPDQVALSGNVPTERARDEIAAAVKKAFPRASVSDRMELASGDPKGWLPAVLALLPRMGQLDRGSAELKDTMGTLTGETEHEGTAEEVRKAVRNEIPAPFRITDRIAYKPSAEFEAKRKAEETLRLEAAEAKRKADEDARLAAAAEAQRQAEENARLAAAAEARRKAEEAALQAAAEAQRKSDEAARVAALEAQRAQDQAKRQADLEASKRQQTGALQTTKQPSPSERCRSLVSVGGGATGMINFKSASAEIEPDFTPSLDRLVEVARACAGSRIEISGHTDAEGAGERNKVLSERRAQAVAAHLVKAGIEEVRIRTHGLGEEKQLAPSDSEPNKAKNRRVEYSVKLD